MCSDCTRMVWPVDSKTKFKIVNMKKIRKSTWLCSILFVYITGTSLWLAPGNKEISNTEKITTISVAYIAILILWFLLRRKEKLADKDRNHPPQP